jgi:hypothetical protein
MPPEKFSDLENRKRKLRREEIQINRELFQNFLKLPTTVILLLPVEVN